MSEDSNSFKNIKVCRIVDSDGYYLVICKGHPKAQSKAEYVAEHILVMEAHIGRYLKDDEVVHHIDHNRKNNEISNLQLMTRGEHTAMHNIGNTRRLNQHIDTSDRACYGCGNKTTTLATPKSHKTPYPQWIHLPEDKVNWYCRKCYRRFFYLKYKK